MVDLTKTDTYEGYNVPDADVETALKVIRTLRDFFLNPKVFSAEKTLTLSYAHATIVELTEKTNAVESAKKAAVEEAREKRVCRVCRGPIYLSGGPIGAAVEFREMVFPTRVTFNFGEEFAHTECLEKEKANAESREDPTPDEEGFDPGLAAR